jgi:hypothetical protein
VNASYRPILKLNGVRPRGRRPPGRARAESKKIAMENNDDPLAQFGLDAIDLRWTLKDIAAKRSWMINKAHVSKLIELGGNAGR